MLAENWKWFIGGNKQKGIIHLTVTVMPMFPCTLDVTSLPSQHICARRTRVYKRKMEIQTENSIACLPPSRENSAHLKCLIDAKSSEFYKTKTTKSKRLWKQTREGKHPSHPSPSLLPRSSNLGRWVGSHHFYLKTSQGGPFVFPVLSPQITEAIFFYCQLFIVCSKPWLERNWAKSMSYNSHIIL